MRILCIDDEPLLTEAVLELNHHSVTAADGGESGLTKFYEAKFAETPFDLVITGGSDTPVDAVLSKPPRVEELLATVGPLRAA